MINFTQKNKHKKTNAERKVAEKNTNVTVQSILDFGYEFNELTI